MSPAKKAPWTVALDNALESGPLALRDAVAFASKHVPPGQAFRAYMTKKAWEAHARRAAGTPMSTRDYAPMRGDPVALGARMIARESITNGTGSGRYIVRDGMVRLARMSTPDDRY